MTLDEFEAKLKSPTAAAELFPDRVAERLKAYRVACHPDRFADPAWKARAEAVVKALVGLADGILQPKPLGSIKSPKAIYRLDACLHAGDVADIYLASSGRRPYTLKASRIVGGDKLLLAEKEAIETIRRAAQDTHYGEYFPGLVESFAVRDKVAKRVNVFVRRPGLFSLEEVKARHPKLDGRTCAWIFKRLLAALGFAHRSGFVHGAVLPPHVLLDPAHHGLQLVGWGQSTKLGGRIASGSAKYMKPAVADPPWYPPEVKAKKEVWPPTDIYMAARCVFYLAGDDPADPHALPDPFTRFLRSCTLDGASMRPDDAWALLEEFDELLLGLYGKPSFRPFPPMP